MSIYGTNNSVIFACVQLISDSYSKMSIQKKSSKKVAVAEDQREKQQLLQMKKIDNTSLKEQIYQLRQQVNYLFAQKKALQGEMTKANSNFMKDSFQIEKTIKIQEQELTELQNNLRLLKFSFEEARKKNKNEWEAQLQILSKKKQQEKDAVHKNISQLQKKINYLKDFKIREVEYVNTINRLKEKHQMNKAQQLKDIDKIVNEHEGKRRQIKQTVSREIENIKQLQVNKLEQKMSKEQQTKKQNELIMEEILLCQKQKAILQEEYKDLINGNKGNRNQNATSLLEGQASETYQRSLRVIKLENKITKMKQFLQLEITRLQDQAKHIDYQFQSTRKQLQAEIAKAESWLKLKQKDLKKMKACSQMVLNQRSSLESYLLEVFHEHSELDYKDPSNTNQILRYLFIKINSRKPPVSYKDYILSTQQSQISKKSII